MTNFTIPFERVGSGPSKARVTIGLFPTKFGWEVPAYVNFDGWNECPEPAVHVVKMKRWFEEYGAELVGMNGDPVEMFANRPQSRQQALQLAEQQFLDCEDIALQGMETIEALAAGLCWKATSGFSGGTDSPSFPLTSTFHHPKTDRLRAEK